MDMADDDLSFAFMAECAVVANHQTDSRIPQSVAAPASDSSFEFFPTARRCSPTLSDLLVASAGDHEAALLRKEGGRGSAAPKRVSFALAEPASRPVEKEGGMPRGDGGKRRRRRRKQRSLFGFVVSACRECQAVEPTSKNLVSTRRIIAI